MMGRVAAVALALLTLGGCAGEYCATDHSGLNTPALWSSGGVRADGPDTHGAAPQDVEGRR